MNIDERIDRRVRTGTEPGLVSDYEALAPVAHPDEPVGRGSVLEELLDALDPVFDDDLPPSIYVHGPSGAGKSAVVTTLVAHLDAQIGGDRATIGTATRVAEPRTAFVYVDARVASTEFGLYRAILDALLDESIPEQGVGTDYLRDRLRDALAHRGRRLVVAVDHVGEPETFDLPDLADTLGDDRSLSWIAVGDTAPSQLDFVAAVPETVVELPRYEGHALVDVLTERASVGLTRDVLSHGHVRQIASWAGGNAHDALAGLFGAAVTASAAGHDRLTDDDVETGTAAVPRGSVPLGRVLALSANRQRVLRGLLDLDDDERGSVEKTAGAIADLPAVDLSQGTVKRYLYELAEVGITERVRNDRAPGKGRPPSRVEPRFPTLVFRELFDANAGGY